MPFLRTVTRGRGVPDERLVEVSHHYQALGGVSPINEQNRALRAALRGRAGPPRGRAAGAVGQPELGAVARPTWSRRRHAPAAPGCSGWPPRPTRRTRRAGSTGRTSAPRWPSTGLVGRVRIDKVRPYFDQPGFLRAVRRRHRRGGRATALAGRRRRPTRSRWCSPPTRSRESWPTPPGRQRSATTGPAARTSPSICAACRAVVAAGGRAEPASAAPGSWLYQSRSGPPPMPWLEPDINDVIAESGRPRSTRRRRRADRLRLRPRRGDLGSRQRGRGGRRRRPGCCSGRVADPGHRSPVRRGPGRSGGRSGWAAGCRTGRRSLDSRRDPTSAPPAAV